MSRAPPSSAVRRFMAHRAAPVAAGLLLLVVGLVVVGPWLAPFDGSHIDFDADWGRAPDAVHWFGTDDLGRDLFARTLAGGRVSLLVGVVSTLVSLGLGVAWGAVAGTVGGRTDEAMMRTVDVLYALPFMFLVILLTVLFGRQLWLIFVAVGLIHWLDMARVVRGQTLALQAREFVAAARVGGATEAEVIRRHIVPNLLGVVAVYVTLTVPQAILVESFLSFLGLGVQEPATSWGALVSDGARQLETAPWALVCPAGALGLTLLCCHLLGDGLRDALDVRGG